MLLRENYTAEHILRLREETGADPSILERTVFAFGLLEAIRSVDFLEMFIIESGMTVAEPYPKGGHEFIVQRALQLNIAKTKRKCGIIERQNYNLPKSEDSRSPETPKEKAIIEAFKAFRMI